MRIGLPKGLRAVVGKWLVHRLFLGDIFKAANVVGLF
jgi:hypothetical protein